MTKLYNSLQRVVRNPGILREDLTHERAARFSSGVLTNPGLTIGDMVPDDTAIHRDAKPKGLRIPLIYEVLFIGM